MGDSLRFSFSHAIVPANRQCKVTFAVNLDFPIRSALSISSLMQTGQHDGFPSQPSMKRREVWAPNFSDLQAFSREPITLTILPARLRVYRRCYEPYLALCKKGDERLTDFGQLESRCLPCCVNRTVLLDLLDHAFEVRVAGAKAPCEPVSTALGHPLAVSNNLELTGLTRRKDGFNIEAILDHGHETRDLGFVVLSRRAVNDLDPHDCSPICFL